MHQLILLAQRNKEINSWLDQHPLVLGGIFLAIGAVVGGWGLYEIKTGTAHSKRGKELKGTEAKALAIVRIVAGAGCVLFGAYKALFG